MDLGVSLFWSLMLSVRRRQGSKCRWWRASWKLGLGSMTSSCRQSHFDATRMIFCCFLSNKRSVWVVILTNKPPWKPRKPFKVASSNWCFLEGTAPWKRRDYHLPRYSQDRNSATNQLHYHWTRNMWERYGRILLTAWKLPAVMCLFEEIPVSTAATQNSITHQKSTLRLPNYF